MCFVIIIYTFYLQHCCSFMTEIIQVVIFQVTVYNHTYFYIEINNNPALKASLYNDLVKVG